jgi:hypothetical protein
MTTRPQPSCTFATSATAAPPTGSSRGARSPLEERVTRAAEAALAEQSYVSAVDVLLRLGWLAPSHLDLWRQGRVDCLERMVQAGLGKQSTAMRTLRTWASARGLTPSETAYVARTRDRRRLRFSVSGNPDIELAYRTHWLSPDLSARKAERVRAAADHPPDLVVVAPRPARPPGLPDASATNGRACSWNPPPWKPSRHRRRRHDGGPPIADSRFRDLGPPGRHRRATSTV